MVFAVLVQVAIVGQWFYGQPPAVVFQSCKTPLSQIIGSLGYPGALLLAVSCLAVRARGVRDNNHEAAFIGLAVGLSVPIWIGSAIGSVAMSAQHDREAWLAFGLLSTSIIVFLVMFLPKGRQLAALGREPRHTDVVDVTDRDDALSSLPGSGYSPSFFHFKPTETSLKEKIHYHSPGCFP